MKLELAGKLIVVGDDAVVGYRNGPDAKGRDVGFRFELLVFRGRFRTAGVKEKTRSVLFGEKASPLIGSAGKPPQLSPAILRRPVHDTEAVLASTTAGTDRVEEKADGRMGIDHRSGDATHVFQTCSKRLCFVEQ